jgi:sec-independent protein translocase protein TatB
MFEIGFTEILLILGIALLVLGPEKLPGLARQVGRWAGRARGMARQFREQLDDEVLRHERDWERPAPPHGPAPAATPDRTPEPTSTHPVPGDPEPVLATIPLAVREAGPDSAGTAPVTTTTETGDPQNPLSDGPGSASTASATHDAADSRGP